MRNQTLAIHSLAIFTLAALPVAVGAQSVQSVSGRVIDDILETPLAATRVSLLGGRGRVVGTAESNADGEFMIEVENPGRYLLRAGRIGYPTADSPPFEVGGGEDVVVTFRLNPEAVLLSPLTVDARERALTGRFEFVSRCAEYQDGTCLGPVEVALLEPMHTTDLFRRIPGILVMPSGSYGTDGLELSRIGGGCMTVFLDDNPTPLAVDGASGRASRQLLGAGFFLDQIVPAEAVRAIEVYMDWDEIPEEFLNGPKGWAVRPDRFMGRCSVVQIWTRLGW